MSAQVRREKEEEEGEGEGLREMVVLAVLLVLVLLLVVTNRMGVVKLVVEASPLCCRRVLLSCRCIPLRRALSWGATMLLLLLQQAG